MNLARAQSLSVGTKIVTRALGVAQTLIVVRLLSQAEYGLVGLVLSVGSVIGVAQHLGVDDGTVHKIATAKDTKTSGQIFWVAHLVRQLITLPLSLGLLLLAATISTQIYNRPEITFYLQLFALILILQGIQGVFGATLTGLKKFTALYAVQVTMAVVNVVAFAWLVWQFGITGFFAAMIVTTGLMVALFIFPTTKELRGSLALPSWEQVKQHAGELFRVSAWLYLARIFFTVWQRLPLLVFGGIFAAETLGEVSVGIQAGMTLVIFSAAISEVNLSWMSSLYAEAKDKFVRLVRWDIGRIAVFLGAMTIIGVVFATPLTRFAFGAEYLSAVTLIRIMIVAFFFYAVTDVISNTVLVAAKQAKLRAASFGVMFGISAASIAWLFYANASPVLASWGMLVGAAASTTAAAFFARKVLAAARRSLQTDSTPIVCFAGAFYNAPTWTNRQQILSRVARTHSVLYIEPRVLLWRNLNLKFLQRIFWPQKHGNLFALAQFNILPASRRNRAIAWLNLYLFNYWRVSLIARLLGFAHGVVWIYDTEAAEYLTAFKENKILYDCVDDHAAQAGANAALVKEEEKQILARANAVAVTSKKLLGEKSALNANVRLVEQAADVESFMRLPNKKDGQKVVGSVGAVDKYKIDVELVTQVATQNPELNFVFVGGGVAPAQSAEGSLQKASNVKVTGLVDRRLVPQKVAEFDVCIIPYRNNAYNASSFPLKFWEFMATGKPIVVTGLPELKQFAEQGLVYYANNAAEFSDGIKKALADPNKGSNERIELAKKHSWEDRASKLLSLLS